MCGGNTVMGETWLLSRLIQVSKPIFLPGSSEKCVGFFCPARCLGRGAAQIFMVMPTSVSLREICFLWFGGLPVGF